MKEDYLQYVWKFQLFKDLELFSVEGEPIMVMFPGIHNHNSGPDFLEAKLKIGHTLWYGSVEIHVRSSDWKKHKHEKDPNYNNVVLHVVYEHDTEVRNQNGYSMPVLSISNKIIRSHYTSFMNLINNDNGIPCGKLMLDVPSLIINSCWIGC